tara:strand:+ start:592 stop:1680 length:1089 start_codon:yes stop_codon:yes gene_type:complete
LHYIKKLQIRVKKIIYKSNSDDLLHPADRRRFYGFISKRNFQISLSDQIDKGDIVVLTNGKNSDLSKYVRNKVSKNYYIVYDCCDAYLAERKSLRKYFRAIFYFLSGKYKYFYFSNTKLIKEICKISDAVICSSKEQKNEILKYSNNVEIILDLFDDDIFSVKKNYDIEDELNIFWEGQGDNIVEFNDFAPILNKLGKKIKIKLHIVSDKKFKKNFRITFDTNKYLKKIFYNIDISFYMWSVDNLNNIGTKCDIAIIPSSKKFSKMFINKSPNKLHIMWKLGLPTLTSFSYSYSREMKEADIDMICRDASDWEKKILYFYENYEDRRVSALKGLSYVNKKYSDNSKLEKWDKLFNSFGLNIS